LLKKKSLTNLYPVIAEIYNFKFIIKKLNYVLSLLGKEKEGKKRKEVIESCDFYLSVITKILQNTWKASFSLWEFIDQSVCGPKPNVDAAESKAAGPDRRGLSTCLPLTANDGTVLKLPSIPASVSSLVTGNRW
jgi:hypothetical protein